MGMVKGGIWEDRRGSRYRNNSMRECLDWRPHLLLPQMDARAGMANFLLIYSAIFLFHHIFQLPCSSFVVLSLLPLLYVDFSFLLSRLLFMGSDGESFYSSTILSCFKNICIFFTIYIKLALRIVWKRSQCISEMH
jgi:hypothetical protein